MARFLITCWSFPGHLRPCLALADSLRARGHRVAVYTGPRGGRSVEEEGFEFLCFRHVDETRLYETMFRTDGAGASMDHPLRLFRALRYWLLETVPSQVEDLREIMERWNADLWITDVTLWAPFLILAERHGLSVAVLSFAPGCMIPHPRVPPWGLGLDLPSGWIGRARYTTTVLMHRTTSELFRRRANRIRRAYGLPPIRTPVNAHAATMPLYLIPSARELDDPRDDLPPTVHYVGPLTQRRPRAAGSLPAWLSSLNPAYPKVHVTEGTVYRHEPFLLKAAVEAFGGRPFEIILTAGDNRDLSCLRPDELPPNVHLETFVPHEILLPKIDCLVTTGGAGTVLAALEHGVPMVVVPTEWDKPDNARHVKNAGAAVCLSPKACSGPRLRQAVEQVLSDPTYRERAGRMSRILGTYRGGERAAELLEDLCKVQSQPPPGERAVP